MGGLEDVLRASCYYIICIYIYIYIYTYAHTYAHTYIYIYIYIRCSIVEVDQAKAAKDNSFSVFGALAGYRTQGAISEPKTAADRKWSSGQRRLLCHRATPKLARSELKAMTYGQCCFPAAQVTFGAYFKPVLPQDSRLIAAIAAPPMRSVSIVSIFEFSI